MKPTVLFLFNSSNYAVQPWLDDGGFNVVSVDYDDTDHSEAHGSCLDDTSGHIRLSVDLSDDNAVAYVWDALDWHGLSDPSLVVSFAPCTDLAVSGAAHFERKRAANPNFQTEAVRMARLAEQFDCPYMVENPVSVLATMWRKPDMYFHPWEFGAYVPIKEWKHPEFPDVIPFADQYNKKTCLWTGNGFILPIKQALCVNECYFGHDSVNPGHAKLGGKSARTKYIRSLTPRGFAQAVYEANRDNILSQWGTQVQQSYGTLQTQLEMNV